MKTVKIALSVLVIISYMLIITAAISDNTSGEIETSEQITSTNQTIAES
jgi:hypothetical protein